MGIQSYKCVHIFVQVQWTASLSRSSERPLCPGPANGLWQNALSSNATPDNLSSNIVFKWRQLRHFCWITILSVAEALRKGTPALARRYVKAWKQAFPCSILISLLLYLWPVCDLSQKRWEGRICKLGWHLSQWKKLNFILFEVVPSEVVTPTK